MRLVLICVFLLLKTTPAAHKELARLELEWAVYNTKISTSVAAGTEPIELCGLCDHQCVLYDPENLGILQNLKKPWST